MESLGMLAAEMLSSFSDLTCSPDLITANATLIFRNYISERCDIAIVVKYFHYCNQKIIKF